NPNCKHCMESSGVLFYTPLMLAAEFDNLSLFQHLVEKGGDLKSKAKYTTSVADGSLEGICKCFGSDQVLDYLLWQA
ncbi:MAG: hypothetical protein Q9M46_07230, partial [Ghiorsea sp.]|nr:hypothetical protein [Ghiorsea sp.]